MVQLSFTDDVQWDIFKYRKLVGHECLQMMCSSYRPGLNGALGIQRRKYWAGNGKTAWKITITWFDGGCYQRVLKCFENIEVGLVNSNVKWGRRFGGKLSWWQWPLSCAWKRPGEGGVENDLRGNTVSSAIYVVFAKGLFSERRSHHIALLSIAFLIGTVWKCSLELVLQKLGS